MLGQERFKSEFIVSSKLIDYEEQKSVQKTFVHIKAKDTEGFISTDAYTCNGTYIGPRINIETGTANVQYALAVGNMVDKVIICKSISKTFDIFGVKLPIFHALELIKNVNEEYLKAAP